MKLRAMLSAATALTVALPAMIGVAQAQTQVQFWHAFTGRLGELLEKQVSDFNASQEQFATLELVNQAARRRDKYVDALHQKFVLCKYPLVLLL